MNKILNINLGGYALTIDDDAFEYLEAYIQSIRRRFSESDGRDEIVHDIESRLGELLTEDLRGRTIVMLPDVEAAVRVMGKPEDFGADPIDNRRTMSGSRGGGGAIRTGKRLFRDEEDAIVGGVCSGLSAYFGIADPLWMRLIFVLLSLISFGFWMPAYILMWILVPAAKTAADRLSMRGQPINVDNIAREIEDGFDRISHKVNEFGSDAKKKSGSGGRSFGNALAGGVSVLGRLFGLFVQFIAKFGVLIAIIICIGVFISLAVAWAAGIWSVFQGAPYLGFFSPISAGWTYFGLANLFFLFGIPLLGLCLMFARALFKTRTPRWLSGVLTSVWVLNVIAIFALGMFGVKSFRQGSSIQKTTDLNSISSDTLRVTRLGGPTEYRYEFHDGWDWWNGDARFNGEKLTIPADVKIRVRRSTDGQFRLVETISARGNNASEAARHAESIEYQLKLTGNTLEVPLEFTLQQGQRWRNQRIHLLIEMPVGKFVTFDEKIYHNAAADLDEYADGNDNNYISRTPDRLFKMTRDGLLCADCPQWGDRRYRDDRNYEEFILEGNFETEIRHGDEFTIEVDGQPADKELLKNIRTGNKLTLTTEGKVPSGKMRVTITAPTFTALFAQNTGDITIRGFEEHRASISVRGTSNIRSYMDVNDFEVSLSGKCSLDLTGDGNQFKVSLADGAALEATAFRVDDVTVSASDGSRAHVNADGRAIVRSDAGSTVKVDGGAHIEEQRGEN